MDHEWSLHIMFDSNWVLRFETEVFKCSLQLRQPWLEYNRWPKNSLCWKLSTLVHQCCGKPINTRPFFFARSLAHVQSVSTLILCFYCALTKVKRHSMLEIIFSITLPGLCQPLHGCSINISTFLACFKVSLLCKEKQLIL